MAMIHLDSKVQQYGRFTPGQRVFCRTPKLSIGAIGNPFSGDFMNPVEEPTAKTQNLISTIYEVRQASSKPDFQNKLDTSLIRRVGNAKKRRILFGANSLLYGRKSQK